MRKFTNGAVVSFVEDDDLRIPAYIANGWKEERVGTDEPTELHDLMKQAVKDANESEPKTGGKKGKATAAVKKVNAAIKSKIVAAAESVEIDDGLIKKGGK